LERAPTPTTFFDLWGCMPSPTTPTQQGVCSSSFDEKGHVLAHGFFPNNDESRGIYFDKSENWYFGEPSNTPDGQTNFYTVLLHKIGHTLCIEHSANNNSFMYAYYKGEIDK
jgi:hypothetical protein